jgi:hypothetical protein
MADFGTEPQKFLFRLNWPFFLHSGGPEPMNSLTLNL